MKLICKIYFYVLMFIWKNTLTWIDLRLLTLYFVLIFIHFLWKYYYYWLWGATIIHRLPFLSKINFEFWNTYDLKDFFRKSKVWHHHFFYCTQKLLVIHNGPQGVTEITALSCQRPVLIQGTMSIGKFPFSDISRAF